MYKSIVRARLEAVAGLLLAMSAQQALLADTHYVNVNNISPTPPYTNWATAANQIQHAVDAASSFDTVLVTNGIYTLGGAVTPGYILFNRVAIVKPMTVRSVNGPESTIIYGHGPVGVGAARCAYLVKGELLGFSLSNGHTLATGDSDHDRSGGGALIGYSGIISNCIITSCAADYDGGGAKLLSSGVVVDSLVLRNSAEWNGGGVACESGGVVRLSTIIGNVATNWAGGVFIESAGTIDRCIVTHNSAYIGGGTYYNGDGMINNSLFARNTCGRDGGGVFLSGAIAVQNCTICENSAARYGGGVVCWYSGGTNLNTLIYHNSVGQAGTNHYEIGTGSYYANCCTYPALTGSFNGAGNVTNDPDVVDLLADDYHLASGSPCIGAGNNLYAPGTLDLDGRQRVIGLPQIVDIGCYEFVPQDTDPSAEHYVSPRGGNVWPYASWPAAAHNIQDAIDAAVNFDSVLVAEGVYDTAYRGVKGMNNRIAITKHLTVMATNSDPSRTVIAGESDPLTGGMGTNGVRSAYIKSGSAFLTGFTLSNGFTRGTDGPTFQDMYQGFGGAALMDGSATISNCVLTSSEAVGGGGLFCQSGGIVARSLIHNNRSPGGGGGVLINAVGHIIGCSISNNYCGNNGGGVFMMDNPTLAGAGTEAGDQAQMSYAGGLLEGCEISWNTTELEGGGIYCLSAGFMRNCVIFANKSSDKGGGIQFDGGGKATHCVIGKNTVTGVGGGAMFDGGGEVVNCLMYGNFGIYGGGAYFDKGGVLESSTVASNWCVHGGGGVYCEEGGSNINCIVYANRIMGDGGTNYHNDGPGAYYTYCCTYPVLTGAFNGTGNITNDPDFVSPGVDDFHLTDISLCIDAGTNMPWTVAPGATDLDGNPRIHDGTVDMGCYEWIPEPAVCACALIALAAAVRRSR